MTYSGNVHHGLGSTRLVGTTAEGTFPKIDSDLLYASEANRLAYAPRFLVIGSGINVGSVTGFQNLGSILIGAGSVSNPCEIGIKARVYGGATGKMGFVFSGAQGNQSVYIGGNQAENTADLYAILGSPLENIIKATTSQPDGGDTTSNTIWWQSVGSRHFNTGSPFVIFWQGSAVTQFMSGLIWSVQSFRGQI